MDLPSSSMTQNLYDDPEFFRKYSKMDRSLHGLAGAPEWPSLRSLLPDLQRARVLDLGCGFGWFSRWAREHGAGSVLACDISEKMIEHAVAMTSDDAIAWRKVDLEQIDLPENSFDLAFSSLVLHYIENLDRLFASVCRSLAAAGWLVFSAEHPLYTAPHNPAWITQNDGSRVWALDQYLVEGARITNWLTNGVVKQHRTIGRMVNALVHAGFNLTHLEEWGPSDDQIAARPDWAEHRDRPMFLLAAARKAA